MYLSLSFSLSLSLLLPPEVTTKGHRLYWMTDRTPHEALPLKDGMYRQFFRLVTSRVSLWFQDHSTPNPNGVKPDPQITKIVKGSKFDDEGVVLLENPIECECELRSRLQMQ